MTQTLQYCNAVGWTGMRPVKRTAATLLKTSRFLDRLTLE